VAREELPSLDVTLRGAVSIGRRLQDPLAELVKIDPKSIGVGQYQHDVDQPALAEALKRVVETVVNRVGVDLNTASPTLLRAIAGLGPQLAQAIVAHRAEHGAFDTRAQLKKVPRLGARAFEQCAGFLRVAGKEPLDASAVHPERYELVTRMAKDLGVTRQALVGNASLARKVDVSRYLDAEKLKMAARAFHFNVPFRFPVPTDMSLASVPQDTMQLALTGAGFGDVYLSPLHGATLASVAANKGLWRAPVLFEGEPAELPAERVVSEDVAAALTSMMEETVTDGTARRIFHERGMGVPGAVGKTGSLADKTPFRDYTWFVGFAPRENPRVAVAAVIVNDPHWRIRATWLGREAMRLFLTKSR
jgi:competence ComEA-like helix-hairpin-helix protein